MSLPEKSQVEWDELVVRRGSRSTRPKRWFEAAVTLTGWLWLSAVALQVLLSSILWVLGWNKFHVYVLELLPSATPLHVVRMGAAIAAMAAAVFVGWASYNRLRFGRLRRRKPPAPVSDAELAEMLGVPVGEIERWQREKVVNWPQDR
ncbi:poly-beta-1,6-N-acetyl-D-glucosamine biosynthesis protein PgaD [Alicyclobacillus mali]|uniref:Poly-beta-1,6-N-acetyl-D-glucosamine biosynthesis protein PgaD n=1 Tax=Alicyclobacillus mali (ex Roth et al. 2021) TaxID=1123961 RepID=A0ABS0F460_9BACL|nr:poly-beta-1,6-N-acetyl-D-glucosamine biosynthesis protein PgaD [Alicyclobacillus mali (ex Roth et al. 2021)]MBF8378053.1 poly-beta-1,6-N-acetyl-D-glucosamine biosynthesis protein PgaD [Alicyclobacillus mali (ex Roth et al. 2021)]MCL6488080.1 poly-beta-1,6-N-acetyl-D-glucosamine biosynthesis protein PgaD [Alicyclobacillus mali (ex Roth et al. 2021)]